MQELLKELNEEQIKPVTDTEGEVLVLAGAGSGKTRVLTSRVAYLIEVKKVSPYEILAITFTNKAANEMKDRISRMVSVGGGEVWVSTFHSFCTKVLRFDCDKLGYESTYSIYSESDQDRILKRLFAEYNIESHEQKKLCKFHISNAKTQGLNPNEYENDNVGESNIDIYCAIFQKYNKELKQCNAMDFDDLLMNTTELFDKFPDILIKYQQRFRYVLIDEFQDANKLQYRLMKMIAGKHHNLFAVGDDDQSIYSWRGADINNILGFKNEFKNAKIYKLERNYRSTPDILNAANTIICNNHQRMPKVLWTERQAGVKVVVGSSYNDRKEADYVIENIYNLMRYNGYKARDFAILVRFNAITRLFEEKLNLYNIAYKIFGGHKFYERKEIKDVISYLRVIVNPRDKESLMRIINFPKRGIGDIAIAKLREYCEINEINMLDFILDIGTNSDFSGALKSKLIEFGALLMDLLKHNDIMPLSDFIDYMSKRIGFEAEYKRSESEEDENRLLNIDEFIKGVKEFASENEGATAKEFLESVALISDVDNMDSSDYVTISTIHMVKGLEFKVVFIVGLEEGIFPGARSILSIVELEEERRVMYVAITRAMERLYLTYAWSRYRFNKVVNNVESRFVREIAPLAEQNKYENDKANNTSSSYQMEQAVKNFIAKPIIMLQNKNRGIQEKDYDSFAIGVSVEHIKFGKGRIISTNGDGKDKTACIAFEGLGIKTFTLQIAPITVIKD